MGTDGFEFVEFTAPDTKGLGDVFEALGFRVVGKHRSKNVLQYRQGDINLIVNAEPASPAEQFAAAHGPSACAMAFRVKDAAAAYDLALANGAKPFTGRAGPMELNIPAIEGIGGSALYLVDRYGGHTIYDVDFVPVGEPEVPGAGLLAIDQVDQASADALDRRNVQFHRANRPFDFPGSGVDRAMQCASGVLDAKGHGAGAWPMLAREPLRQAIGFGVDDEIDIALAVKRHFFGAVTGDTRKAHGFE